MKKTIQLLSMPFESSSGLTEEFRHFYNTFKKEFTIEVRTIDPDTGGDVHVSMFKHEQSGGIFGIDSSFITETFDDDEDVIIADPFNKGMAIKLIEV